MTDAATPMIVFEQVHKWFGPLHVLDNINLSVRAT